MFNDKHYANAVLARSERLRQERNPTHQTATQKGDQGMTTINPKTSLPWRQDRHRIGVYVNGLFQQIAEFDWSDDAAYALMAIERLSETQPAPETGEWRLFEHYRSARGERTRILDSAGIVVVETQTEAEANQIIADHAAVPRLVEALSELLNEAEFVGEAKQPFSTWVAEKCRAALTALRRSG